MSYYFSRIINNKIKLSIVLLFFFIPVLSILLTLKDIHLGASVYYPELNAFISLFAPVSPGMSNLFFNYLPLLLAIIVADDCIEDYKLGYKNLLITKWGKNKYFLINMAKGFVFSFFIILIPLLVNLVMTQFIFAGGTYTAVDFSYIENTPSFKESIAQPMLYNIMCTFIAVTFSGILGMGATAVSMALHNRFIVYPIVYIMWYLCNSLPEHNIICAFQPFTEYRLTESAGAVMFMFALNFAAVAFCYIKVTKYDKV